MNGLALCRIQGLCVPVTTVAMGHVMVLPTEAVAHDEKSHDMDWRHRGLFPWIIALLYISDYFLLICFLFILFCSVICSLR